jgi:membrane fusion protein (multidrug efflux system)
MPAQARQPAATFDGPAIASPAETAEPKGARKPFVILGVVVLVVAAGIGLYLWLTAGQENTDDAQVMADLVPIGTRVAGPISEVLIQENQLVKKGDIVAKIDAADFRARVKQAEAELASARAQGAAADAQVNIVQATSSGTLSSARAALSGSSVGVASAEAQVHAAEAQLVRAQSDLRKADNDLKRAKELREANAVPQERLDNAQAGRDAAAAALAQAEAQLAAAQEARRGAQTRVSEAAGRVTQSAPIDAQVASARANADLAHARIDAATAALELANLQLTYTNIAAPSDGIASRLAVHPGQFVQVGQPVIELVPSSTYVIANFKETQVGKMQPGQRARIAIDAYPHREFEGKVESLSGGTGSSFSLLPADNASGNFVKVVQRVPVRIAWVNLPSDLQLRAGMSVDATVFVGK